MSAGWFGRLVTDNGVTRRHRRRLAREQNAGGHQATPDDRTGVSNGELSVLLQVDNTISILDRRRSRRSLRAQQRVTTAAGRSMEAWLELHDTEVDVRWSGHDRQSRPTAPTDPPRTNGSKRSGLLSWLWSDPAAADNRRFREDFDPHWALVGERTLLAVEVVFIVVELFFWYGLFAESVDRRAPWYDPGRVSALLLAVLIPLAGVTVARILGQLGHRWVSGYPGVGRREQLGTVVATAIAATTAGVILWLVHARFDEDTRALGSTEIPAWPMALVFVVVLLGDIAARVFLRSEIRAQSERRSRDLRRLRRRAIRANDRHLRRWLALRTEVGNQLTRCEQVIVAGAIIIANARATATPPFPRTTIESRRTAHRQHPSGPDGTTPGLPDPEQLALFGSQLALAPLRSVADGIDVLRRWPARGAEQMERDLADLVARLYATVGQIPHRQLAEPAPPGHSGDGRLRPTVAQPQGPIGSPAGTPNPPTNSHGVG